MISLNENNWMIWNPRMENLLYGKDLHGPLEGEQSRPKKTSEMD